MLAGLELKPLLLSWIINLMCCFVVSLRLNRLCVAGLCSCIVTKVTERNGHLIELAPPARKFTQN